MQRSKPHSEEQEVSGTALWLVLIKAYHSLLAYTAETLRGSGLGDSDFRVLEALLHKGALPVHTIGAKVYLTPGSTSVAVDRLLEKGLVSRTESELDRRVKLVELTPAGQKLIERVFRQHEARINALLEDIPAKDRRRLSDSLKTMGKRALKTLEE